MMLRAALEVAKRFDAETAHRLTISALGLWPRSDVRPVDERLAVSVAGLTFAHPVVLAAGFDKDARAIDVMGRFGFAGGEVGTLTPQPQGGNPRPRLFRLNEDRAVINRMGFNNQGQADALRRLSARRSTLPVGVNIGANKDAADRIADYVTGIRAMAPVADWLTANISSPNTPGLRALQDEGALDALLAAMAQARAPGGPPLFLKVAPDLDAAQIGGIVRAAMEHGIDALIIGNTTISRPPLHSPHAGEAGGLSGAPLAPLALARLRDFRAATGGALPLIAAGGIASAEDAWGRLRAGASMIQLYSALVYEGPWLARDMAAGLLRLLEQSGAARLTDIIGADVPAAG